jgi:hypothetical protein
VNGNPLSLVDPWGLRTLQCTKPLHALTDLFGSKFSKFAHDWLPAAYHQYSCVIKKNGEIECGGQDHEGSPAYGAGKPSDDTLWPGHCKEVEPDNECFESCLIKKWSQPRPNYGIPIGTDCQEYDDAAVQDCDNMCKSK